MRRIYYHPKAGQDARSLVEYYESLLANLADEFWKELLTAIEYARDFPEDITLIAQVDGAAI